MPRIVKQKVEFEGRIEEREVVLEGDDLPVWPADARFTIVGAPVTRVDGRERVGGTARYTTDQYPAGMLHGVILRSPHAHARIAGLDVSKAERLPGVRAVLSHLNAPKIRWFNGASWLFDPELRYVGDEVAAVIAEDAAAARDALDLIEVEYEVLPHVLDAAAAIRPGAVLVHPTGNILGGAPERYERGNVEPALARAEVTVALTVQTPDQLHHSMETHGSVAEWSGDRLTLWDSTQHIFGVRRQVAVALGIPMDRVRVLSPFSGGGFGSKNAAGKYSVIAALAARQTQRPVRVIFSRIEESQAAGKRPRSIQKIRLGARRDGTLTAIDYWGLSNVGAYRAFPSPLSGPPKELYACPNVRTDTASVFTHTGPAAAFRAPGYLEATVALECAVEALADRLGLDPLEVRLRNYAEGDQVLERPYSSKFLREAYRLGARSIGWERRTATPAQVVRDGTRRGFGMASQIWGGSGSPPAYAEIRFNVDGTAEVRIGTQDIGTGAKTALTQIAAEVLTVPVDRVRLALGDTDFPYSPLSAGSQTIASCGPAVRMAAEEARRHLIDAAASVLEAAPEDIRLEAGHLTVAGVPDRRISVAELTGRMGNFTVTGRGFRGANPNDVTIRTWGAQFAEVEVDTETGAVTVLKVAAAHDVGRVINPLQYASQIHGGVIQGLGLALTEDHVTDPETGNVLDLGFDAYAVPRLPMIPEIDALAVGIPDPIANNLGVKGVGEPPIIPTPAAIANAVANALGVRITDLPITPMKVLRALGRLE
ncbi:MAG: xanthine dehydrogenase family protein molybdopterin-binding subunit [Bacillati bacterium ANGP1]|uniref:Xanthine dehydrogenase family protein molybdopterin-binding subunit n=1 Tax=Candidatus Segetimicrobium genomatis TaxID=2569760 RepID=A0A537JU32_9BACT|nr:MAG: xanthine dehydrogenase family protein molybdopterin-binding subunit [Terrabacteria group bacterium ANGP1]